MVDLTEVKDLGETLTKPTALTQVLEPVPDPEGPRLVMGFFDGNENGELDPDDAIEIADGDPPLEDLEIHMGFESIIKEAPRELTVTTTNPGDSETNVEVETSFSVTFSEPLAAGKRFVSVNMGFDPAPEKFDRKKIKVRDNGHTAFFPVVLAENQTYIWTIRDAVGASGAKLLNPVDVILSTGDTQEEPARVGGTVVLDDGSTPLGTVNLVDAEASGGATKAAEVGSKADIDPSGEYLVDNIPANSSFILFVEVDLGDAGVQQVFFDTDGDGPDIITLEEGEELTGIDFTIEVPDPPEPSEPGVEGPNLEVTLSPDANPAEGDQGLVTLAGLGTNARVDIAVYMNDLEDVWSYTITAEFDSAAVAFDGADAQTEGEGTNLLNTSDAFALFLPPLIIEGISAEFGGSLLGTPNAAQAPDGDGLGAVFHFVTNRSFVEETTITFTQIVVNGVVSDGVTVTDTNSVQAEVTLVPLTATFEQADFTAIVEVEGPIGAEIIDENGVSIGRVLEEVVSEDTLYVNVVANEGAEGVTGFSARFEFNPAQISYVENSFIEGSMMVGLTPLTQAGSGFVEVGGAAIEALGGEPSTSDSGVLGSVQFAIEEGFSGGAFIALTSASYLSGETQEEFDLYTLILLGEGAVPPPPPGDGDDEPSEALTPKEGDGTGSLGIGDLETKSLGGMTPGQQIEVPINFDQEIEGSTGFFVVLTFDPEKVSVVNAKAEGEFAGTITLPFQLQDNTAEFGGSFLGQTATATGPVATLTFETLDDFSGETEISLTTLSIKFSGGSTDFTPGASVVLSSGTVGGGDERTADFTGDGVVNFDDFFQFALAFGQPATGEFAKFDLDGLEETIGFGDFFAFAGAFGTKPVATKPSGLGAVEAIEETLLALRLLPSDEPDLLNIGLFFEKAGSLKGYGAHLVYDPTELAFIESMPAGTFAGGEGERAVLQVRDRGTVGLGDVLPSGSLAGEGLLSMMKFRVLPGGSIGSLRFAESLILDENGLTHPVMGAGLEQARLVPESYGLGQNFPNPFNPVTQINYQVPQDGRVRLVVYNLLGQEVRRLVDGRVEAGFYQMVWDGRDALGRAVSSGVYFYRMVAGEFSQVRKMVFLK